jgi:hypothetical protein
LIAIVFAGQFPDILGFIHAGQSRPSIQLCPLDYKKAVLLSICALKHAKN